MENSMTDPIPQSPSENDGFDVYRRSPFFRYLPVTKPQLRLLVRLSKALVAHRDSSEFWYQSNGQEWITLNKLYEAGYVEAVIDSTVIYSYPNGMEAEPQIHYNTRSKYRPKRWMADLIVAGTLPILRRVPKKKAGGDE
jgi:hypothetical protein